jgi:hypothetical protein
LIKRKSRSRSRDNKIAENKSKNSAKKYHNKSRSRSSSSSCSSSSTDSDDDDDDDSSSSSSSSSYDMTSSDSDKSSSSSDQRAFNRKNSTKNITNKKKQKLKKRMDVLTTSVSSLSSVSSDSDNSSSSQSSASSHKKRKLKSPKKAKKSVKTSSSSNKKKSSNKKTHIKSLKVPKKKLKTDQQSTIPKLIKSEPCLPSNPTTTNSNPQIPKFKNKSKLFEKSLRQSRSNSKDNYSHKSKKSKHAKSKKSKSSSKKQHDSHTKELTERHVHSSKLEMFDLETEIKRKTDNINFKELNLTQEEVDLFDSLISRELDPNGGAYTIICDQEDLNTKLFLSNNNTNQNKIELLEKFAIYFLNCVYSENQKEPTSLKHSSSVINTPNSQIDDETSSLKENDFGGGLFGQPLTAASNVGVGGGFGSYGNYVIGVIRNSAKPIPEIVHFFANKYPQMIVKSSFLLNSKEINTIKMSDYQKHVNSTYMNGTYRYGPLLQTSIVGIRNEEIGDFFPDFLEYLESNPFLRHVMPWGDFSLNENMNPMNSDDGPIIWARPGEQYIPTSVTKEQLLSQSNNIGSNANNASTNDKKKK